MTDAILAAFEAAGRSFAGLVRDIPATAWDGPGLGEWDLRSLVGHTARSLITVSTYLQGTAERVDVATPADYYVLIRPYAARVGAADIVERGRQAGRDLGADPAAAVENLLERVLDDLSGQDDRIIAVIGGLGIRLYTYLPTRTFELAVHSLDIAGALGGDITLPPAVAAEAAGLAAAIAVTSGQAEQVLLALTGRAALPPGFSVV